jgi:hypothetical protein
MTLQTIKNRDRELYREPRETNKLSDIMGAQPRRMRDYQNKTPATSSEDIAGSRPRKLHVGLNKPSNFLVNDIEGAHPASRTFHSRRCVNPLSPKYDLPTYVEHPAPVNKFIRDSLDNSDLEGAQPRKPILYKTRDNINVSDIVGAAPKVIKIAARQSGTLKEGYEPVSCTQSVMDIAKEPHRSITGTHPMRPVYVLHDVRIEDDIGSYPRKPKASREPFYSLHTEDITGAKAFSGYRCFPHMGERRDYRKINDLSDMEGAKADTHQRGLQSKRVTDPLDPRYVNLDGKLATSRTARRNKSMLKSIQPVVVEDRPKTVRTTRSSSISSSRSGSSSRRRSSNQEESPCAIASYRAGADDHIRCRAFGLVPVSGDESLHPQGRGHIDGPLTKDHFSRGMVLDEGCSTDCSLMKGTNAAYLHGIHDHIGVGMVPEGGADGEFRPMRRPSIKSDDQTDHIGDWNMWALGGRNKVAKMKLAQMERKLQGRRASDGDVVPFMREANSRPGTSGRVNGIKPLKCNQSLGPRPSTRGSALGDKRSSVTSRSASSLRSGNSNSPETTVSQTARPSTTAPCKVRSSRGSRGSRSSRSGSQGSTGLSHREISQTESDRRSVAELPDTVIH